MITNLNKLILLKYNEKLIKYIKNYSEYVNNWLILIK